MKKTYFLSLLLMVSALSVAGQEKTINIEALALEDAVSYSLTHSPEIIAQRLKEQQAGQKLSQFKLDYLPDIYATSDLRRNLIIQSTPIPAMMLDPSAPKDELAYMRFNTPWNSGAGLNVDFDIFNPETAGRKSEQEKQLKISRLDSRIAENELKANVSQAYIDCAIAQAQLDAVTADTAYYALLLQEAKDLYRREKISLADKNNSEMNYNVSLTRFYQAKNILHNARVNLLLSLGEEPDEDKLDRLSLSDDIQSLYSKMALNGWVDSENPLSQRRQAELVSLSEIKTKNAVLKYAPSLSLSGYYGANYFGKELKLGNTDRWFGNSFLALSLRIPISRSLSTAKEVSQLRMQEQIERENLRDLQNNRRGELSRELAQLETYKNNYRLKLANLELIAGNVAAKQLQLQKKYILESEFSSEKLREQNTLQEYLQAAYDVLSACINMEKLTKN
ncbi:MAG: TolC family protein [Petrimonas sp.]|uniref:TolC family protein n=1 Tax=Petrimonas sp. TaxID=2023866 RepID=UPI002B3F38EA|nr:TolC family protein [Petrimonas sp.]MEA4979548.1 TolC family protein [Petrimonas sp.]MEA5043096.1 TolC family protein [Petrimonas sp.]MEA5062447.1 TolC family protein [Petrimonas sp.]